MQFVWNGGRPRREPCGSNCAKYGSVHDVVHLVKTQHGRDAWICEMNAGQKEEADGRTSDRDGEETNLRPWTKTLTLHPSESPFLTTTKDGAIMPNYMGHAKSFGNSSPE